MQSEKQIVTFFSVRGSAQIASILLVKQLFMKLGATEVAEVREFIEVSYPRFSGE